MPATLQGAAGAFCSKQNNNCGSDCQLVRRDDVEPFSWRRLSFHPRTASPGLLRRQSVSHAVKADRSTSVAAMSRHVPAWL
jgi:hypothetical protein